MDPDAIIHRLAEAAEDVDVATVCDAAFDYQRWREAGGHAASTLNLEQAVESLVALVEGFDSLL